MESDACIVSTFHIGNLPSKKALLELKMWLPPTIVTYKGQSKSAWRSSIVNKNVRFSFKAVFCII